MYFGGHSEAGEPFRELAKGAYEVGSLMLRDRYVVGAKPKVQGQAELMLDIHGLFFGGGLVDVSVTEVLSNDFLNDDLALRNVGAKILSPSRMM